MTLYSRSENNAQSLKVLNTTEKNSVDKYDWDNTLIVNGPSTVEGSQGYSTAARRTVYIDDVEATLPANRERGLTAPGWWEYMTYTDAAGNTRHKAQHLVAFKDAPANTADLDDNVAADVAATITISAQPTNQTAIAPWGGITGLSYPAANALREEGAYEIGPSDYTTNNDGTGASFTVYVSATGAVTVDFVTSDTSGGQDFSGGDTITIPDSLLGGGGAPNVVLTVTSVSDASATFGVTASVTGSGSPTLSYQWQTQAPSGTKWTNLAGETGNEYIGIDLVLADNGRKYRVKITSSNGADEVISNVATLTTRSASWYWND